jgi:hypothetical protein|tara:strand:- start:35 stop:145 length:111 start_codon:yes stop_codon:yes gene_type:complete
MINEDGYDNLVGRVNIHGERMGENVRFRENLGERFS